MSIYVLNIALLFYWWFIYWAVNNMRSKSRLNLISQTNNVDANKKQWSKIFLILPFVQIYLLLSLKDVSVGTDTPAYKNGFDITAFNIRWADIFNTSIDHLVFNFERGFIFLTKIITVFTTDFTTYSAIIYLIMIVPLYKFVKRHSTIPFLSLILFISLGFLNFYFSGMRQAIAFSLVLLSYDFIVERKKWKFFGLIAFAMLFHKSAIFFVPAYFLVNITFTPLVFAIYSCALVIVYFLRTQILSFVARILHPGLEIANTGAYTLLLIVFLTFIAGMFTYKGSVNKHSNNKLLYNLIATAVLLMIFNTVSNIGLRAANYYYIFMIVFIPNVIIPSFKGASIRLLVTFVVISLTLAYYFLIGVHLLNGTPYKFFW